MNKWPLLLISLWGISFFVEAQITFQKAYGGNHLDYGQYVQQTRDSGYIIGANTIGDIYLVKTDVYGNLLWTRTFGGSGEDDCVFVQQTSDDGFVILGITSSFGVGIFDLYLIKTDIDGEIQWSKTFGGVGNETGYSIQQTFDGGFIISGATSSFGVINNIYIVKTDLNGDSVWTKCIGGTDNLSGCSIQQTSDSGYIITGPGTALGAGYYDASLIKLDADGNILWCRKYGGSENDISSSVQQTTDGGFILAGWTESFGAIFFDVYLVRTNSYGDTLWTRTFGGSDDDKAYSVKQTNDGGFIVAGTTASFGSGIYDIYLIKTNAYGDSVWTRTFGGSNYDKGYSVQQTFDNGYILTGFTSSFGVGNTDIYLVKTDVNGHSGCNEENTTTNISHPASIVSSLSTIGFAPNSMVTNPSTIINSGGIATTICTIGIAELNSNSFAISPNPTQNSFTIQTDSQLQNAYLEIHNLLGEKIYSTVYDHEQLTVNCEHFPPGIYFVSIQTENGITVKKLIKQ